MRKDASQGLRPDDLVEIRAQLDSRYPDLRIVTSDGHLSLRGSYPILHEGVVIDRYTIEMDIPADFPSSLPRVLEIGGRIPRTADRHINQSDFSACLFLPEEYLATEEGPITVLGFLDGPVRNFFLGQTFFEREGRWPFGERAHGADGILEYYSELLGTSDKSTIVRYLECLSREALQRHWVCPCGSDKTLRNCHLALVRDLRAKISPRSAAKSLASLRRELPAVGWRR